MADRLNLSSAWPGQPRQTASDPDTANFPPDLLRFLREDRIIREARELVRRLESGSPSVAARRPNRSDYHPPAGRGEGPRIQEKALADRSRVWGV